MTHFYSLIFLKLKFIKLYRKVKKELNHTLYCISNENNLVHILPFTSIGMYVLSVYVLY